MCKIQIRRFLAGLFLAVALGAQAAAQSGGRPSDSCESASPKISAADKISAVDKISAADKTGLAVARAEERVEALRAKLFDLQMQEIELRARVEELEIRLMPEAIHRQLALVGSVRPMDELRNGLRKLLESDKARVTRMLELLVSSEERLEAEILEAEAGLERARERTPAP
jgi:TolA-binding protein